MLALTKEKFSCLLIGQVPRLSNNLEKVDVSVNSTVSQGALLLDDISSLQHHIQGKRCERSSPMMSSTR